MSHVVYQIITYFLLQKDRSNSFGQKYIYIKLRSIYCLSFTVIAEINLFLPYLNVDDQEHHQL